MTSVAVGQYVSVFLKSNGSVWVSGDNLQGRFGDGTLISTDRPKQIFASGITGPRRRFS